MKNINDLYIQVAEKDIGKSRNSWEISREYLENSTAKYHGKTIDTLYIPKIFTEEAIDILEQSVKTLYSIFEKVINEYFNSRDYRKLFGFSPELEKLILINRRYDSVIPMARIDIFLNEEDLSFKFCEFNTDGASSMNEDRETNKALQLTYGYKKFSKIYKLKSFELFDSWIEEFQNIYSTYKNRKENPNIAIVDFLEKASSLKEFEQFRRSFEKAGFNAEICEIRDLKYMDGKLFSPSGMKIDAVYRRAVTSDIIKNFDEVNDFIEAVKDEKVCTIGDFATQIVHSKILFSMLHHEKTME